MRIIRGILSRVCGRLGASMLYQSRCGMKCINQPITSNMFTYFAQNEPISVPSEDLHLWVDHLNDKYTMIGSKLADSPHIELMRLFSNGEDITNSKYMVRRAKGALDFAPEMIIDSKYIKDTQARLAFLFNAVESRDYEPIKIINIKGSYYLADGKHRAAICAVMDVPARCVDVTPVLYDSFFWWVYRQMLKNPQEFSRHIAFNNSILAGGRHAW